MSGSHNAEQKRFTMECITEALFDLMRKGPYEKITVSAIARRAGVSRVAFYRHYETKDDVVRNYLDGIFESFREGAAGAGAASREEVARLYFSEIQKNEGELRLLHDAGKAYFLYARIREHVGSNMRATREGERAADDRYVVAAVSGVLYSITIEWIKGGCVETPEELSRLFLGLGKQK